jgi:hypothetical protein
MGLCGRATPLPLEQQFRIRRTCLVTVKAEPIGVIQMFQRVLLPTAVVGPVQERTMMFLLNRRHSA